MLTSGASGAVVAVGGLAVGTRVGGGGGSSTVKSVVGGSVVAVGGSVVGNSATETDVGSGGAGWLQAVSEKIIPIRIIVKTFIEIPLIELPSNIGINRANNDEWRFAL